MIDGHRSAADEVTRLLHRWQEGDGQALARLVPCVYDDLKRLAQHFMTGERADHTLQATALVHEAFLRLPSRKGSPYENRQHFLNTAAQLMRRLLVDHARARTRAKRGGADRPLPLDEAMKGTAGAVQEPLLDLIAMDEALDRLASFDERKAKVLELRFFSGLSVEETAQQLGVSGATVALDSRLGRAWLLRELGGEGP